VALLATGKRMDNLNADRPGEIERKGYRFFVDDEDEFGLEDILQALCFLETGETYVPPKPWEQQLKGKRVRDVSLLSETARKQLEKFLTELEKGGAKPTSL
jgi:hypothetical protein